jgi:hypothetical protein
VIAYLEMLVRFFAAAFEASAWTASVSASSLTTIAVVGVLVLAGGAAVATRAVIRVVAALLGATPTDRAVEPPPVAAVCAQDDPTTEGHPRPRAPGRSVPAVGV